MICASRLGSAHGAAASAPPQIFAKIFEGWSDLGESDRTDPAKPSRGSPGGKKRRVLGLLCPPGRFTPPARHNAPSCVGAICDPRGCPWCQNGRYGASRGQIFRQTAPDQRAARFLPFWGGFWQFGRGGWVTISQLLSGWSRPRPLPRPPPRPPPPSDPWPSALRSFSPAGSESECANSGHRHH